MHTDFQTDYDKTYQLTIAATVDETIAAPKMIKKASTVLLVPSLSTSEDQTWPPDAARCAKTRIK